MTYNDTLNIPNFIWTYFIRTKYKLLIESVMSTCRVTRSIYNKEFNTFEKSMYDFKYIDT